MLSTIGELELRDEYALLSHTAVLSDVAKALSPVKNSAALIRGGKGKGIIGIVKVQMLLKALSQGGDPNRQKASDCMGTNLLRVRVDMPVGMALTKIAERNPDAVIVLDMEKKFVGYLSAEDYRSIKNQFRVNTAEERIPTTIGEAVDLRDEFRNVSSKDRLEKAALLLRRPNVQFVLAQNKKKGIEGVLSVQHLLSVFAKGLNPDKEIVRKHMRTNLLRLSIDTPIDVAIEAIEDRTPDGVLVLNTDKSFAGFLSPDDYRSLMKHGGPKINNDGTLDSLLKLLKERTADSNEGPVVWTHAGSELLIRNQDITVKAADNILHVYVPVESDQTGLQIVTLRYYLGNEQQMERMAVADQVIDAPEIITTHWGLVLQESIWSIILQWIDADTPAGKFAEGFALDTNGKVLTKAGSIKALREVNA